MKEPVNPPYLLYVLIVMIILVSILMTSGCVTIKTHEQGKRIARIRGTDYGIMTAIAIIKESDSKAAAIDTLKFLLCAKDTWKEWDFEKKEWEPK